MSEPQRPPSAPDYGDIGYYRGDIGGEEAAVLYQKDNKEAWIQSSVTVAEMDIYE